MILTYEVTDSGYRIFKDGNLWVIQEGKYADVYPGNNFDEKAQKHIEKLKEQNSGMSYSDQLEYYSRLYSEQVAINDILTGGNGE